MQHILNFVRFFNNNKNTTLKKHKNTYKKTIKNMFLNFNKITLKTFFTSMLD